MAYTKRMKQSGKHTLYRMEANVFEMENGCCLDGAADGDKS